MITFETEFHDEEFQEWVVRTRSRFETMVLTLMDVAELIHANTNWRVPLDTGRLEESFRAEIIENTSDYIEVHAIYDAVDPKSGFHYAEYQHDEIETWQHYNSENRRGDSRGQQFYLKYGTYASEDMAMQIIETDYLSLFGTFRGGY